MELRLFSIKPLICIVGWVQLTCPAMNDEARKDISLWLSARQLSLYPVLGMDYFMKDGTHPWTGSYNPIQDYNYHIIWIIVILHMSDGDTHVLDSDLLIYSQPGTEWNPPTLTGVGYADRCPVESRMESTHVDWGRICWSMPSRKQNGIHPRWLG